MNSLNSILLEGNLTRHPEARTTPKGTPLCTFSVASNRYYRVGNDKQQEVSFFDIEAWSQLAERCVDLEKGRGVRVVGRLKQERWVDQEGKPHSQVKIIAEHVEFKPMIKASANKTALSEVKLGQPMEAGDAEDDLEDDED
jgi:single-strand DNA-binding protein